MGLSAETIKIHRAGIRRLFAGLTAHNRTMREFYRAGNMHDARAHLERMQAHLRMCDVHMKELERK